MTYAQVILVAVVILGLIQIPLFLLLLYSWRTFDRLWRSWEESRRALTLALLAVKNQPEAAQMHAAALQESTGERGEGAEEYDDEELA